MDNQALPKGPPRPPPSHTFSGHCRSGHVVMNDNDSMKIAAALENENHTTYHISNEKGSTLQVLHPAHSRTIAKWI